MSKPFRTMTSKEDTQTLNDVVLQIPFKRIGMATVSLPAFALMINFWTSFLFQIDEVTDTDCLVTNVVPSASAVMSVSPQRYLWRIAIALHCLPRFAVPFMYYNYYHSLLHNVHTYHRLYKILTSVNFWCNTIESAALVAVSYISNKDNYPIHEKLFIVYMATSLVYMLTNTTLYSWSRSNEVSKEEQNSLWWKKCYFFLSVVCTVGLLIFFVRHRFYCIPYAFSYFSAFEYGIAYLNMFYHYTAMYEFGKKLFVVGSAAPHMSNGSVKRSSKKDK